MQWILTKIKTKIRDLSARPTTNQLSNDDLLEYINAYYQYTLPDDIKAQDLWSWYELSTSNGVGSYTLDSDIQNIAAPVTIDGVKKTLYIDADYFFTLYPRDDEGSDTYDEPASILFWNRTVYLRPIPDGAYTLRVMVPRRPTALSADSDRPVDDKWGPLIAYAVAIDIMMDNGENPAELVPIYAFHKDSCRKKQLYRLANARAVPRF